MTGIHWEKDSGCWVVTVGYNYPDDKEPKYADDWDYLGTCQTITEAATTLLDGLIKHLQNERAKAAEELNDKVVEVEAQHFQLVLAQARTAEHGGVKVAQPERKYPRRALYKVMRRFYRACHRKGLNPRRGAAMRAALEHYFGCEITSISQLTAEHWEKAGTGVLAGKLGW